MDIRNRIMNKLIEAGAFWSYDEVSVRSNIILFPKQKIKKVWLDKLVVQGDFYYSLNRFYAWYYFDIRYPDRYLKSMQTRHLSRLTA